MFVVEPSGNLDHEIKMFLGLLKGDCTGGKILTPDEEYEVLKPGSPPRPLKKGEKIGAEFVFSGTYDNWVESSGCSSDSFGLGMTNGRSQCGQLRRTPASSEW